MTRNSFLLVSCFARIPSSERCEASLGVGQRRTND